MSAPPVRLVCFDLGGVVIRICRTWAEGCAAAGLPVRDPGLWAATRPARGELIVELQTGRIDGAAFAARASSLVDGLYSPAEILAVHNAWMLGEYPGVVHLVDRLSRSGFATAALSNTNHVHWTRIGGFPAIMRMDHLLASHQLGLHKPDPAIYRAVERHTGWAGPEILFFDDTAENVDAARALGWHAEVIDPAGPTAEQMLLSLRRLGLDLAGG